ncbi:hypothetical protein LCGC14_1994750 [marine sediment metagenome]|uniref:Uncharacterized protein n=1 Tax=marine sediment metagenome TaxID=412755 RepID=A0A0F9F593_9ZZZZ
MAVLSRRKGRYTEDDLEAKGGYAVDPTPPQEKGRRLWDNTRQAWTPSEMRVQLTKDGLDVHLNKVVFGCSGCGKTSGRRNQIVSHIEDVFKQFGSHQNATVLMQVQERDTVWRCSACTHKTIRGEWPMQDHIDKIMNAPALHEGAVETVINKFSLQPPAVQNGGLSQTVKRPESTHYTGGENGDAPRPRGRRRRRSRSRANGHSG